MGPAGGKSCGVDHRNNVVSVMDLELRRYLNEVYREHDSLLAEIGAPEPLEAQEGGYMRREASPDGLLYRVVENAPVTLPAAGDDNAKNAEGWDQWLKAHLAIAKAEWFDEFARGMGEGLSEYTHEKLMPHVRAIAELRGELAECKGLLTSALSAFDAVRATTEALQQEKCERAIRADAWASHYDTVVELRRLQLEVAELRDIFGLVVATLRTQAEADVATLRRQLEYALARIERRPDKPLH